ncbi:Fnta, partial [Symbiodinium microadriaticum]
RELMDLFRAVLQSGEKSERVLELTEEILDINAANYTVWQYRRETLFSLNYDLNIEMDYMDTFAEENPKNYQIWFHRRVVVERLGDSSRELPFTASVFLVDAKNYHAWSHRQWVLTAFSLWEENELEFVDAMLEMDIRNNSAWNYRWFFLHGTDACAARPVTEDRVESEIAFTFRAIEKVKLNESAWNYLTGLRKKYRDVMPVVTSLSIDDRLASMLERFDVENVKCYFLWEALADIA